MTRTLAVLPGDGIGPEVTEAALQVLDAVNEAFELDVDFFHREAGGVSIRRQGVPITDQVVAECRQADAILLGAVGGPEWDHLPPLERPERALLRLRKELDLYANLRPVRVPEALEGRSMLRPEAVRGTDLLVVRELTSGLYYGEPRGRDHQRAWNTLSYTRAEVERVARKAFDLARTRRRKITSVDKSNVLETGALWREVVSGVGREYPDVELEHRLVDAMAMHLVSQPTRFDVILTENLFGDILSEEAAVISGSLGLLPSASLGGGGALYEPVHGSAPDIAGRGWANPLGAIGSLALALRYTLGSPAAARAVEEAMDETLADGPRTRDLGGTASTGEVAASVVNRILVRAVENQTR